MEQMPGLAMIMYQWYMKNNPFSLYLVTLFWFRGYLILNGGTINDEWESIRNRAVIV
jgi:hypothetical protein